MNIKNRTIKNFTLDCTFWESLPGVSRPGGCIAVEKGASCPSIPLFRLASTITRSFRRYPLFKVDYQTLKWLLLYKDWLWEKGLRSLHFRTIHLTDLFIVKRQKSYETKGRDVGTGEHWGYVPPRFCNKQRSALFIYRKCPLYLKDTSALEVLCPQVWDASYVPD